MRSDDDYGDSADENLFSYFDEILKKPTLQEWFGWDDTQKKFLNQDRIREFYSWIVRLTDEDDGEEREVQRSEEPLTSETLKKFVAEPRAWRCCEGQTAP